MDQIRQEVIDRLVRYVKIDTTSDGAKEVTPSTRKQFDLAKLLVDEFKEIGLKDVRLTDQCYLYGTCPSNLPATQQAPVVGLIAHLDTSPDAPGSNVKPVFHENYDGKDIALPGDPSMVIKVKESPELERCVGDTVITSDGTTLLGADDKAGISVILTLLNYLRRHPEIKHPTIKVGFTPDEEIGRGADHFDVKGFGADYAYTIDASSLGEIEDETFCADSVHLTFHGYNAHPGYAKDILVSSIKAAGDFLTRLPKEGAPESTEKREGYVHPSRIQGDVNESSVLLLIRDFEVKGLKEKEAWLQQLVDEVCADHKGITCDFEVTEHYRNMRYKIDEKPEVMEVAIEGIRRAGVEPIVHYIRGGTDGARLCYQGLPTPNIWGGGHNFHSKKEWASVKAMTKAVEALSQVVQVWAERPNR